MKIYKAIILIFLCVLSLYGCTAQPKLENNAFFTDTGAQVSSISIVDITASNREIWHTNDRNEILTVMSLLNNWVPEDNKAVALDLFLTLEIRFDEVLTIQYSPSSKDYGYYCRINNVYYYLPAAFGEYIENIIAKS